MFEDIETHKKLSKWIIGTFTACILIYLGIRHISHVADAVMWLKDLLNPLLIGLILALFLNVPLGVRVVAGWRCRKNLSYGCWSWSG